MSDPLITIGITCYNEGDWLRECWNSVLAQTDDRWTAVLVMDGTTHERTRAVFAELEHPKLRKLALPTNVGPFPTRNHAFALTTTPYHFYLDADDELLPDSVHLVLEQFARHPDAGFIFGDYECLGKPDTFMRFPVNYSPTHWPPGGCAYRKSMWEQLGGFADELARGPADYDFFLSAIEAGIKGYHCGHVFYRYRTGHPSVSGSYRTNFHEVAEILIRRHPKTFGGARQQRSFLAWAYRRSAVANQVAGHYAAARALSWAALRRGQWRDRRVWRMALLGGLGVKPAQISTQTSGR